MKGRGATERASWAPPARVQLPSAFCSILDRLVKASSGVLGAVLSDEEGEAVDFSCNDMDPEELKLAAAYLGILVNRLAVASSMVRGGGLRELWLKGRKVQFLCRPLGAGYHLTVVITPLALLPRLFTAMDTAIAELRVEAGGVLD